GHLMTQMRRVKTPAVDDCKTFERHHGKVWHEPSSKPIPKVFRLWKKIRIYSRFGIGLVLRSLRMNSQGFLVTLSRRVLVFGSWIPYLFILSCNGNLDLTTRAPQQNTTA